MLLNLIIVGIIICFISGMLFIIRARNEKSETTLKHNSFSVTTNSIGIVLIIISLICGIYLYINSPKTVISNKDQPNPASNSSGKKRIDSIKTDTIDPQKKRINPRPKKITLPVESTGSFLLTINTDRDDTVSINGKAPVFAEDNYNIKKVVLKKGLVYQIYINHRLATTIKQYADTTITP